MSKDGTKNGTSRRDVIRKTLWTTPAIAIISASGSRLAQAGSPSTTTTTTTAPPTTPPPTTTTSTTLPVATTIGPF